ncbi:LuxR C-terminal-related transcriptional regulator [Glycomyces sp. TRM65418]|uniref:LuxR family transcriptional regulator n=1 Tax=Glycomyces sp. TRM65418 TaxID=2867006 RepID=UPI001CE5C7AE|nr:LuxR family transcriptional regulator [Glycomyces sp. TRM65418]MCC3765838.1 LuxR C-terminal-related transcriptional regulator [Glycomyces sp. TRM65418]QZD55424.1 LuxR C-terminal-related transcriptional regulator [Glycomyces sp. TRM65418]
MTASVRLLDDGSLALVLDDADSRLLAEAGRSGTPILVHVAAGLAPDRNRAMVELARGLSALGDGPVSDAHASLLLAGSLSAGTDARLALIAILAAADAAWAAGDRPACLAALQAAGSVLTTGLVGEPAADGACAGPHDHLRGLRALIEQRPADALAPLGRVLAFGDEDGSSDALHRASVAALLLGDVETACRMGRRALAAARAEDRDDLASQILEYLAYAEMRAGRHATAHAHAVEGLRTALLTGRSNTAAHHRAVLALAASVEGHPDTVVAHAEAALATARRHGLAQTRTLAEWALARMDLGRGRPDAAASRLGALVRPGDGHFALRPLLMPCFIEAAVLAGRPDTARPFIAVLESWAGFGLDRAAAAQLARCRALLATADSGADAVETEYCRALELHAADIGDFECARTQLLYGNWLRRRRRPREARAILREALHGFEACGARPWIEQTRAELRATGDPGPTRREAAGPGIDDGALASLTPHQRRVAQHVASGATNREVAQALSVSVRTVDHHLRNIFAVLGVRSRVELARLVAEADAPHA